MYYLVLLQPGEAQSDSEVDAQHEAFIDDLIRRNEILLGGNLAPRDGLPAAYLLACKSRARADEITQADPYVRADVFRPTVLAWQLVAINPDAMEADLVLRPGDLD